MASLNKVLLIGNLGQEPEAKYMPNGDAVVNISIATSEKWTDKSGDKKEHTEWHRVVFFGRLAEVVTEYCKKGSPIFVEGKLKTRKWADKDGVEKYTTEIHGFSLQLLGARSERDDGEAREVNRSAKRPAAEPSPSPTDFDDDIPF